MAKIDELTDIETDRLYVDAQLAFAQRYCQERRWAHALDAMLRARDGMQRILERLRPVQVKSKTESSRPGSV